MVYSEKQNQEITVSNENIKWLEEYW
jgi:hypothetical protein